MRKKWKSILAAAGILLVLAAMLWAGSTAVLKHYVFWNGALLPRQAQSLNITGKRMRKPEVFLEFPNLELLDARDTKMTVAQYEWLCQQLPDCVIHWDVPIQGGWYSQDTTALTVPELTDEEINALKYLPALKDVDLGEWEDYTRIARLQQQYPRCRFHHRIILSGEYWDSDSISMILRDAQPAELAERLPFFYRLESILLTGTIPDRQVLRQLQEQFPDIFFLWKMEALGMTMETDMRELDISEIRLESIEELENLLPYFPALERVALDSTGLDPLGLVALAETYPGIHFIFDMPFGENTYRTDAEEIDISNTPLTDTAQVEAILPCFRDLQKVVMCECGISSEEMDALNKRYPDIRFVWSVNLGGMLFRTDAVHFTPNRWGLRLDDENIYDLRYCTDMVCVDIGHNMRVTNCEWVAFMPNLKYLVLAETGISDLTPLKNHENLIFLELFLSRVKDYSPLTTCLALEDLNLCYTNGDPAPIAEMTWLKRLWWSGCWLARETLKDQLPDTYTEYLSLSSTGRGWREGQHYYDMRDFIGMEYMVG